MTNTKALVTLAIGASFRERWAQVCQPNWQTYADRHGYDLLCIQEPLDTSPLARKRSPAWQKCLILSQDFSQDYERIVWVDLDILLNPHAPDIAAGVPLEQVGAVDEYSIPTRALHQTTLAKLYHYWESIGTPYIHNLTPESYYRVYGFEQGFSHVVQTGVMVLSPSPHRNILEFVYHTYEDKGYTWNYEMRPLSYELLKAGCVHWLDPRFNYLWGLYQAIYYPFLMDNPHSVHLPACLDQARRHTYFLHFAGDTGEMPLALHQPAAPMTESTPVVDAAPQATTTVTERISELPPVALFLFNRPHTTDKVFDAIRQARPSRLLLIADGPRPDHPQDADDCAVARAIVGQVDWPCDLLTNFADTNLGLKQRFDSGMGWIFSHCEEAILLEDDCLPEPSFFHFCAELLKKYRHDERIFSISGNNFQFGQRRDQASYYFSRVPHIWGWATWKRAWALYDPLMRDWPAAHASGWLEKQFQDVHAVQYWSYIFQQNYETGHTWDYAWHFSTWRRSALHILPHVNLVSNHGFGPSGTHTGQVKSKFAAMLTEPIAFPLVHPDRVEACRAADDFTEQIMFSGTLQQLFARIRRLQAARKQRKGQST
jgi:hypothetical protein